MNIAGSYDLDAPAERIWPLIFDPAELLQLIPGCEQIEQISPGEYRGRLNLRVAAVGGTFQTTLKIIDQQPLSYARFEGEAAGPGGVIKGQATFRLSEAGPQTNLTYEGQALITGPLGNLNSRLVEGVAQALIHQGLDKLNAQLQAQAAASLTSHSQQNSERGGIWRKPIGWLKRLVGRLRRAKRAPQRRPV
jgi:uncharacterized protein